MGGGWCGGTSPVASPPLGEAITYAFKQWDALTVYTTDGDLAIDNNASENALLESPARVVYSALVPVLTGAHHDE